MFGNCAEFCRIFLILSRKFRAADSIYVITKMFSGLIPLSKSFTISASNMVVFPAPGTAEIAILPVSYARTGF